MNQVVAVARPVEARSSITDVVRHRGRARREDRHIGTAIVLELELRLHALTQLIVGDLDRAGRTGNCWIFQRRNLRVAKYLELFRRGSVVTVAIDDHELWILSVVHSSQ